MEEAPTQEMFDELLDHVPDEDKEVVVDCGQDLLDMVVPEGLTVRTVADLYGPEERVEVIDVKSQQGEERRWNMGRWADYYESPGNKAIRNVISLEVSQSALGRLIRRPKVVRDLDLQDAVWPGELRAVNDYPKVQFYCLMSVADCYTDFHIDFGGSWVYYHILKGKKVFFFIPPKEKHLKKYEEWCNSPAQESTFLGDQTKECYRVDLSEGDTMLIPSGWIHAVWTPENSLVIGGNFLTRLSFDMQLKVAKIEKETKVPRKFRYPFFQKIQWYTALRYLQDDPIPSNVLDSFLGDQGYCFKRKHPIYYEMLEGIKNAALPGSPYYNARTYSKAELDGLFSLARYLLRTAMIASSYTVDGVMTTETRNAVKRSIPRGIGDPVDMVRRFGVWVAWKVGNEPAPRWVYPGVIESEPKLALSEKRTAGAQPSRRLERHENVVIDRKAEPLPWPPVNGVKIDQSPVVFIKDERVAPVNTGNQSSLTMHDAASALNSLAAIATDEAPSLEDTSKKGRIKACDDCRRSKVSNYPVPLKYPIPFEGGTNDGMQRRCIHDGCGNVDPDKAQERAKPRMTTNSGTATKRPRPMGGEPAWSTKMAMEPVVVLPQDPTGRTSYASPPTLQTDDVLAASKDMEPAVSSLVSPPTSHVDEMDVERPPPSRHSSRKDRIVGRHVPEMVLPVASSSPRHRNAKGDPSSTRIKSVPSSSSPNRSKPSPSKRSASRSKWSAAKSPLVRKSVPAKIMDTYASGNDEANDPDAESMRLIRELQEQDFGLRRRR